MSEATYPRVDGAFLVLGPEIFTGDGVEQPQDVIMWKGAAYRRDDPATSTGRIRYVAAAQIAIDDAAAAQDAYNVDQQLARAQAYATLASVEQARIANLIAWKALQTQRQSGPDNGIDLLDLGGDEITQQIQEGLEIA